MQIIKNEKEDLEKLVNKLNHNLVLNKSQKIFLGILIFGSIFQAKAQQNPSFGDGTKYVLANIDVTGNVSYNQQTVVTFAGLQKGQTLTVPGEEISSAIKKLGKLGLFSEIDFYVSKVQGDSIYLELNINELPKLNEVKFVGVKKNKTEALIKDNDLKKGKVVNENLITTTRNFIEKKYKKDGYFNTKVTINTVADSSNAVNMVVKVDKGDKLKIRSINFEGNEKFTDAKLRKAMKNTKQKNFFRVLKSSKYIKDKYKEDLVKVMDKYKEKGYRDARIISDTVFYNPKTNDLSVNIKLEEGNKYYFGDIKFLGNTIYTDQGLSKMLGIERGDVYNGVLLQKRIADNTKPDGDDITNLYQNNGYLWSNINAVEVGTANDTIDFEIRVVEGPIAYFNNISVVGNDKTNDRVIYRELRTRPGQRYSKEDLVRTYREIGALGFFDPEKINPRLHNVDANAGTVDVEWQLVEKGASQVELQGGYGGGGFIGTLGLSFNNFSVRNLFKGEAYKPLPMGDGQKVALRLQGSSYFQTYSLSFSEPWFGGEKPVSFSTSFSYSKQYLNNYQTRSVDRDKSFNILSMSVGLAKRLTSPDDSFVFSNSLSFQYYDLNNYNTGLFTFGNGTSRNFAYTIGLSRSNKGSNPIFPTYGSDISISAKLTPPYSLLNGVDYAALGDKIENKLQYSANKGINVPTSSTGYIVQEGDYIRETSAGSGIYEKVDNPADASADQSKVDQQKFNWLEYYKIKFKADWYTRIYDKLVLRSLGEFGFLGSYNKDRGLVPFERFFVGGDGLANYALDGREVIGLRGYPNQSLTPLDDRGAQNGATIYNKFSLELRYPITLSGAASIYGLTFLEGGAAFDNFKQYNPFKLYRSAGVGLRVHMPAFGLLGIDFGYGFDALPIEGMNKAHGWETHFIIGQQF